MTWNLGTQWRAGNDGGLVHDWGGFRYVVRYGDRKWSIYRNGHLIETAGTRDVAVTRAEHLSGYKQAA